MKKLFLFLVLFAAVFAQSAQASPGSQRVLFSKLHEINHYWSGRQSAVPDNLIPSANGHDLIRQHLQLVEQALRAQDVSHLSDKLQTARIQHLDNLKSYYTSGAFPINTTHSYRLPVFIDPFENFCAVGYLVKASGHEALSRHIAASTNFAYLADMKYPELTEWAANSGLTLEELAWIQPTYGPTATVSTMLGGTNGTVKAIARDAALGQVFAAGSFTQVDGMPNANNTATYSMGFAGPYWSLMDNGLVGEVEALQLFNGELYAAGYDLLPTGALHSVVKWNGSQWVITGPMGGGINALTEYQGQLWGGGSFGTNGVYLATWNGSQWITFTTSPQINLAGTVNALHVHDNKLIIGGDLVMNGNPVNILQYDGIGLSPVGSGVPAKVRALATFKGHLFAGGDYQNAQGERFGLARFDGTAWKNLTQNNSYDMMVPSSAGAETFVSALAPYGNQGLVVGGSFHTYPGLMGNFGTNLSFYSDFIYNQTFNWGFGGLAVLDAPVHALSIDAQAARLYLGGAFTENLAHNTPVASVGYMALQPLSNPEQAALMQSEVFPNPFASSATIRVPQLKSQETATLSLYDILGKKVREEQQPVSPDNSLVVRRKLLPGGMYLLQVEQAGQFTGMVRVVIE